MLETGLNYEIETGAVSAGLATTDDLSEHESPYFDVPLVPGLCAYLILGWLLPAESG
jgi:hypothetical protein